MFSQSSLFLFEVHKIFASDNLACVTNQALGRSSKSRSVDMLLKMIYSSLWESRRMLVVGEMRVAKTRIEMLVRKAFFVVTCPNPAV